MDKRGQVDSSGHTTIVIAVIIVAVAVVVVNQIIEIVDRGLAYTAGALVALGVILLAGWLAYRGGRRLGDWTADRLGVSDDG